jgi:ubiquinone/menaquinone biosynthesis C-methylase UbiE
MPVPSSRTYEAGFRKSDTVRVVEIGSQDVNGSLKDVCPSRFEYVGVDFAAAKNVDIVLTDPYQFPLDSESVDIIVTSSCLEHSEMFWLVFLEMLRVLKPHGLLYSERPLSRESPPLPRRLLAFLPR